MIWRIAALPLVVLLLSLQPRAYYAQVEGVPALDSESCRQRAQEEVVEGVTALDSESCRQGGQDEVGLMQLHTQIKSKENIARLHATGLVKSKARAPSQSFLEWISYCLSGIGQFYAGLTLKVMKLLPGSGPTPSDEWFWGYAAYIYGSGYRAGEADAYKEGVAAGYEAGVAAGFEAGAAAGYSEGVAAGYGSGAATGYSEGVAAGHSSGAAIGYNEGVADGYGSGAADGYSEGVAVGYGYGANAAAARYRKYLASLAAKALPVYPYVIIVLIALALGLARWSVGASTSAAEARVRAKSGLRWWHILGLLQLDSLTVVSESSSVPSLPLIAWDFNSDEVTAGVSLQVNWIVSGIFAFLLGLASDKYGRRPTILTGLSCYIAGAVVCALSPNATCFILARCVMGMGACEGVGLAVVRDVFTNGDDRAQYLALYLMTNSASFALAPLLGGIITVSCGWRMVFIFSAALGLIAFWNILLILPETCPAVLGVSGGGETEESETGLLAPLGEVFSKSLKPFWVMVSIWALMPVVMAMGASLPFVLANRYDMKIQQITGCSTAFAVASFAGTLLGFCLMEVVTSWQLIRGGMFCLLLLGEASLALGVFHIDLTLVQMAAFPAAYILFLGIVSGPWFSVAVQPYGKAAGFVNGFITGLNGPCAAAFGLAITWLTQDYGMYAWLIALGAIATVHQLLFWIMVGPNAEDDPIFQCAADLDSTGPSVPEDDVQ